MHARRLMLGAVVQALRDTLRALMRLLTQRPGVVPEGARSDLVGGAAAPEEAARGAWQLPYEDPLTFPSTTLKSVESRCARGGASRR